VEATAAETASSNWSRPDAAADDMATAAETTTTEASSHSSSPAVRATLRLPDQGRARKKRDPIEFSFHDLYFLCVDAFEFILLNTDNARSDRAVRRRLEILCFPLLLQCVFRLETFDDIDNAAPSHKSGDGGADSLRFTWHHRDFSCEFFCLHRYSFCC
jgi:hypothetical protein